MKHFLTITAVAILSIAFADSAFAQAAKKSKASAPACISCTARCMQCSGSSQCLDACRRNGDPRVKATSACGTWYQSCR